MDDVEDRSVHAHGRDAPVRTEADFSNGLLEQDGVVLVVDGNELEDAVLGDDRNHHRLVGLIVGVNQGDSSRTGLKHTATCLEQGT